jgi:hypothetical protein
VSVIDWDLSGDIGASEVTYQSDSKPKGALIRSKNGGSIDRLSPFYHSGKAIIQYAFFFRDNYMSRK